MSGILLVSVGNSYGSKPENVSVPVISDTTPLVGQTISASTGTWTGTEPISFSYQWRNNGSNISGATSSSYTVQASDEGDSLSVRVTASNDIGSTAATSAATSSVGPARGNANYSSAGTFTWVAPAGVTSVSILTISNGSGNQSGNAAGGGGGGGLAYLNEVPVTAGQSYTVRVSSPTGNDRSRFDGPSGTFLEAYRASEPTSFAGAGGGYGNVYLATSGASSGAAYSGGQGGRGYSDGSTAVGGGGGGAAGYSGNGGDGGVGGYNTDGAGSNGSGGGGGGGGSARQYSDYLPYSGGGGGGGVGIYGEGSSGTGGAAGDFADKYGRGGTRGSGTTARDGEDGGDSYSSGTSQNGGGGRYGGGSGGWGSSTGRNRDAGGGGYVRIVWPAATRQYPSTDVGT